MVNQIYVDFIKKNWRMHKAFGNEKNSDVKEGEAKKGFCLIDY